MPVSTLFLLLILNFVYGDCSLAKIMASSEESLILGGLNSILPAVTFSRGIIQFFKYLTG